MRATEYLGIIRHLLREITSPRAQMRSIVGITYYVLTRFFLYQVHKYLHIMYIVYYCVVYCILAVVYNIMYIYSDRGQQWETTATAFVYVNYYMYIIYIYIYNAGI